MDAAYDSDPHLEERGTHVSKDVVASTRPSEFETPLSRLLTMKGGSYRGARLARIRCNVRRCILRRRAVSETLRLHIS
jgi:hypothetical protein